jgi:hypothetical protein
MNGYRWIPRLPIDGVRIDMIHRERFALTQRLESEKPMGFSTNNAAWLTPGVRKWIGQQAQYPMRIIYTFGHNSPIRRVRWLNA